jgi:hypothetical protein
MEVINGQICYTTEEVMEMTHRHIADESERRKWYLSLPEDSDERMLMKERDEALNEYFRIQGITSEAVLLYECDIMEFSLSEEEKKELERYTDAKNKYDELNERYMEVHRNATKKNELI